MLVNRIGRFGQREPAANALARLKPVGQLFGDEQRIEINVDHQRGARFQQLAISVIAKRCWADGALDARFFQRFLLGGGVRWQAFHPVALGHHPPPDPARGDEQHFDRCVKGIAGTAVRQGGNLAYGNLRSSLSKLPSVPWQCYILASTVRHQICAHENSSQSLAGAGSGMVSGGGQLT